MNTEILPDAEEELEEAFNRYQARSRGLGLELLDEFRRGVDRILESPLAWQTLDTRFRRYRLHRFPYGIIYKVDEARDVVIITALMHLSDRPHTPRA